MSSENANELLFVSINKIPEARFKQRFWCLCFTTNRYSGNQLATAKGLSDTYDANGNTITDGLRGMNIAYNRLNLLQQESKGSDVLAYGYSADGQKRGKQFNGVVAQHYRGSMAYAGDGTPEYLLVPEEMVRNVSGNWVRQYNVTDHLGNTRAVLEPNGSVLQQTDYYPLARHLALQIPPKISTFTGVRSTRMR